MRDDLGSRRRLLPGLRDEEHAHVILHPLRVMGLPVLVTRGSKERLLIDGAGLCSPGHWPPWSRHPTSIFGRQVRAQVELTMREEQIDVRNLIENMSSGKVGGDPFPAGGARIGEGRD